MVMGLWESRETPLGAASHLLLWGWGEGALSASISLSQSGGGARRYWALGAPALAGQPMKICMKTPGGQAAL